MGRKNTFLALLSRGVSSNLADSLIEDGYSLSSLKALQTHNLVELGLTSDAIEAILKGKRPPIPSATVTRLLHESKRTCCICRDNTLPIVIHHIEEWSNSRSHEENNLVVLCLNHHDEAHTKRGLSLNLTKEQLKSHKGMWLEEVKRQDAKAVLGLMEVSGANWDYINHNRVFQLADRFNIYLKNTPQFIHLRSLNIINNLGLFNDPSKWDISQSPKFRWYDCYEGTAIYAYTSRVLEQVLNKLPIIDTSKIWNISEISRIVSQGGFICVRGAFYFKHKDKNYDLYDPKRMKIGYRKKSKIRVNFEFEAWDTTSNTSDLSHLSGHKSSLAILFVKSVSKSVTGLTIDASCIALGSGFKNDMRDSIWVSEAVSEIGDDELDSLLFAF